MWERVTLTGCVSKSSLSNHEPLCFLGVGCRAWLVTKITTRHVMNLLINDLENLFAIVGFQPVEGSRYAHLLWSILK